MNKIYWSIQEYEWTKSNGKVIKLPFPVRWLFWRWWLGLFIQGNGWTYYPPIIKWPPIISISRYAGKGISMPWFYGGTWRNYNKDTIVYIYWPFNFIAAWIKWFWEYTHYTGIPRDSWINKQRQEAFSSGVKYGRDIEKSL